MRYFPLLFKLILLVQVLLSCKKNKVPEPQVHPFLLPYYEKFLHEGSKRGITFSDEQKAISMKFSNLPRKFGASGYTDYKTRTIDIDSIWLNFSEPSKEWLVFHELGHLLLNRKHNVQQLPNGEYVSLMWTLENNTNKCSAPILSGNLRRNYYFDELFNSTTQPPAFAAEPYEFLKVGHKGLLIPEGWSNNSVLEDLVKSNNENINYQMTPKKFNLVVRNQTSSNGFKLPMATLFPILNSLKLENYEVRLRYKLYGRGFEIGWTANGLEDNNFFLTSNSCNEKSYFGIGDNKGGFFFNKKIVQDLFGINELILQNNENYIKIYLNNKLIFESDISISNSSAPLFLNLYFGPSEYDFEFITVSQL